METVLKVSCTNLRASQDLMELCRAGRTTATTTEQMASTSASSPTNQSSDTFQTNVGSTNIVAGVVGTMNIGTQMQYGVHITLALSIAILAFLAHVLYRLTPVPS